MEYNYSVILALLDTQYKSVKLKLVYTIQNIKFNKDCLRLDVIPNYAEIKINNRSYAANKTKAFAETLWIRNEIVIVL